MQSLKMIIVISCFVCLNSVFMIDGFAQDNKKETIKETTVNTQSKSSEPVDRELQNVLDRRF